MGVGGGRLSPALPSAFMSRSVTFRDKKPVFLLQIETKRCNAARMSRFVTFGGQKSVFLLQIETFADSGNGDNGPFP